MSLRVAQRDLDHILERASADFQALKCARIFITGGTGFVGKWLLESIVCANEQKGLNISAVVLSRDPERFFLENQRLARHGSFDFIKGDVTSFSYPEGEFTHAIHAATDVVAVNAPLASFDAIVGGTRRLLEFCRQRCVRDVLLVSSGAVYGRQPLDIDFVPEDYVGAPVANDVRSAYGEGKRVSEWLAATYSDAYGMSVRVARCFAFVGPYLALDKHFAVGNFIRDVLQGNKISIGGDGTPLRSYLHAADLVIWLLAILVRGTASRPYNVGSDCPVSIRGVAEAIARVAGVEHADISIARTPVAGALPERYVPNISRARTELGLDVWLPLEEALTRTIAWARK